MSPLLRQRLRQLALFFAILMSGGLLSIPREPLLVAVLVLCFMLKNPIGMLKAEFALIWLWLLLVLATALIGGGSFQFMELTIRYANFLVGVALLLVYVGEKRATLADDLYPILKLMAFQAILTPIAYIVASGFFTTFQINNTVYHTLFYIFTYHEFIETGSLIKRPDGFFFEPGVFQIYLNILLFICLFVRKHSSFDIGLAALAVIATQSTTGAIVIALQFGVAYVIWLKGAQRMSKLAVFVFAPLLILPVAGYSAYNLGDKLTGDFRGSAWARNYDFRTGLAAAAEQPLTGIGFDEERYFDVADRVGYKETRLSREMTFERGNTNGIVTVLFQVGFPLSLLFFWGLVRQRMFAPRLAFAAIIVLSMLSESLTMKPFFLMLVFSGLLIQPKTIKGLLPVHRRPVRG